VPADDFSNQDIAYHRATAALYDREVTDVFSVYHRALLDPFLDRVAQAVGRGRALDLGCGTGAVTVALAERGLDVTGMDHSPEMLAIAERKLASRMPEGTYKLVTGDVRKLPFASAEFDCVTCQGLLHHLEGIQATLAEMKRVLKPGGQFYISEPCLNQTPLKRTGAMIWHRMGGGRKAHHAGIPESIEIPVDADRLRSMLDALGMSFEMTFLTHLAPIRLRLPDAAYLTVVRAVSYPWRRSRGDLVFVFGRRPAERA